MANSKKNVYVDDINVGWIEIHQVFSEIFYTRRTKTTNMLNISKINNHRASTQNVNVSKTNNLRRSNKTNQIQTGSVYPILIQKIATYR